MEDRRKELETLLTEQCGKYDSDCTSCPYSKECEEYAKLEQLNTMCLTCKKLGTDCKGTTCQTWTGCAMKIQVSRGGLSGFDSPTCFSLYGIF